MFLPIIIFKSLKRIYKKDFSFVHKKLDIIINKEYPVSNNKQIYFKKYFLAFCNQ